MKIAPNALFFGPWKISSFFQQPLLNDFFDEEDGIPADALLDDDGNMLYDDDGNYLAWDGQDSSTMLAFMNS